MLLWRRITGQDGTAKECTNLSSVFRTISINLQWLLVLSLLGAQVAPQPQPPTVVLDQGTVTGVMEKSQDKYPFFAFYAIPYALPPVGEQRFQRTEPHPGWGDTMPRSHNEPAPPCPQWDFQKNDFKGEEDCLYLNVYTAVNPSQVAATAPLPVMVVLQGFGYSQSNLRLGPDFIVKEDIVVVTLNYRLGVLGFYCTETDDAPGNYGLFDVIEALKWVKHNIQEFGGDRTRVTVMGHSAGAAIVSLLMVSPHASNLFWAGIAHSGSALVDWGLQEEPIPSAVRLADALDCPDPEDHPDKAIECLRTKSAHQIVKAHHGFMRFAYLPVEFAPVVDGMFDEDDPFLPDHPKELFEKGKSSHIPLLTGVTTHEGLTMYQMIRLQKMNEKVFTNSTVAVQSFLPDLMNSITNEDVDGDALAKAVVDSYFRDVRFEDSRQVAPALTELLGDALVYGAVDQLVRLHSVHAQTYTFVLETRPYDPNASPSYHLIKDLQSKVPEGPFIQKGIGHGDDLPLFFHLDTEGSTQSTRPVISAVRRLWCNFARDRNPTLANIPSGIPSWIPYTSRNRSIYRITTHLLSGQGLYRTREAGFWRQLKEASVEDDEPPVIYIYDHASHAAHTSALAFVTAICGGLMFMIFGLIALLVSRRCLPPRPPEPAKEEEEEDPDATSV